MIRFYLKLQNNIITNNLLYIVTGLVLIFNIIIRSFPGKFITMPKNEKGQLGVMTLVPKELYVYCDVYLLMVFIILIFFLIGSDFKNSMGDIALAVGASKTNKFMLRKLYSILGLYFILYLGSYINIYTISLEQVTEKTALVPFKEIIFFSLSTNIFIISLSLLLITLFKDIAVCTAIITAYYLIEEHLWRGRITQTKGVLSHIYQYSNYTRGEIFKFKIFYMLISIIILLVTYKLSQRKAG